MSETPEIPEADDAFSRRVAISIAVLAVCISFIGNFGDNAKTDSILKTSEAANQWAYFQAKSIKGHSYELAAAELELMPATDLAKRDALVAAYRAQIAGYEQDKAEIKVEAEGLVKKAEHDSSINDRCDLAALLLSLGVILCSVAILVKQHALWFGGLAVGAAGAVVGATAFFM
jgi:hypothetical protein